VSARPERKRRLRRLRRQRWYARVEIPLLGLIVWAVLWMLRATTRFSVVGSETLERYWRDGRPVVLVFWHGRSMMLPFLYRVPLERSGDVYIMNSPHRDGEIITRALARFGIKTTRGSASRGGVVGTLELARKLRDGHSIALVPDGPRGPAGVAKPGAIDLAATRGVPLCPLAFSASRVLRMSSWDRLMLPLPGARVVCVVGEPLSFVDGRPDKRRRERLRTDLAERLSATCRAADRAVGRSEDDT
jgi:lysophospholipid acyltransferase (LPLAT)-like uncharacterized protein